MNIQDVKLVDLGYLRATCGEDETMVESIISLFLSSTPDLMSEIRNHFKNSEWDLLRQATHKAKSSLRMMGVKETSYKLEYIENNALSGDRSVFDNMINEIESEVEQVYNELK